MNEIVLIALRRPYTFVVMSILIVLLGTKTILHMPTDIFPNITIPVTSVVWIYSGLLPQQVEGRITYLFERFLTSTVEGIKYIHSHSYFGSSITNIFLQDGVDVARAEADIVGIAQNVVKALPPDISPPMVMRLGPVLHTSGHAPNQFRPLHHRGALNIVYMRFVRCSSRYRNSPAAPLRRPRHAGHGQPRSAEIARPTTHAGGHSRCSYEAIPRAAGRRH